MFTDGRPIDECLCVCEVAATVDAVPDSEFQLDIPAGAWCEDIATSQVFQWNPPSPEWYESRLLWIVGLMALLGFIAYGVRRRRLS
jgi:hypothetical protein